MKRQQTVEGCKINHNQAAEQIFNVSYDFGFSPSKQDDESKPACDTRVVAGATPPPINSQKVQAASPKQLPVTRPTKFHTD